MWVSYLNDRGCAWKSCSEALISFASPVSAKPCGFSNCAESKSHIPFEMIWFLHSKLLWRANCWKSFFPLELNALRQGERVWDCCAWFKARQVWPASISEPPLPMVTLIMNHEFLADFQLSSVAFPVVRSVPGCLALAFQVCPGKTKAQ